MGPLLVLLSAATAAAAPPGGPVVVLDAEPGVIAAARALGPEVAFFTSKALPLTNLSQIRNPSVEVGTGELAGAREIQSLLRAAGVKVSGGAVDLMRLYSVHHWGALFRKNPRLRFFVVRADGREREIVEKGGGVRAVFRVRDGEVGVEKAGILSDRRPPSLPPPAGGPAGGGVGFVTSFGPLIGNELATTARHRTFDARAGVRVETRKPRAGHLFLVLRLERDFSVGVGLISFLYGSGIIVKPEFEQLRVVDAARKAFPLAATHAEGRAVELAYEVPASVRSFILQDGETEHSLAPVFSARD